MAKEKPKKKSSTSDEVMDVTRLTFHHIGRKIRVMGRDVTLGTHQGQMVELVGILDSFRANSTRMVLTMRIKHPRLSFAQPRVIEVIAQ